MQPRFLIAPDKFKGSLTASEAAHAIAEGVRRNFPDAEIDLCPIADGGEGFMETLHPILRARWIDCPAVDALGRPVESRYLLADTDEGPTAIMEMSETAGLWRLEAGERNPLKTTTLGTGMQIAHAIREHRVSRIILGLGGSATNDGGAGMAAALGVVFRSESGEVATPTPELISTVSSIDLAHRMELPEILAACDVDNPLLGPQGATAIFSKQKGASVDDQPALESALAKLVGLSNGKTEAAAPGSGAAGGLGFGLLKFASARLIPGFDLLARLLHLEARVTAATHVITGEGALDHQSLSGKGPVALARMAASHGIPVTGFCGLADEAARNSDLFQEIHALADTGLPLGTLIAEAASLLTQAAAAANLTQHRHDETLIHHRS